MSDDKKWVMSDDKKWVRDTNDEAFKRDVIETKGLQLVDFWAPWCGPCKALTPIIESLAQDFNGQFELSKINVDDNPSTAAQYEIRGIPTVLVFRDGQLVDRLVGLQPKDALKKNLEKYLA